MQHIAQCGERAEPDGLAAVVLEHRQVDHGDADGGGVRLERHAARGEHLVEVTGDAVRVVDRRSDHAFEVVLHPVASGECLGENRDGDYHADGPERNHDRKSPLAHGSLRSVRTLVTVEARFPSASISFWTDSMVLGFTWSKVSFPIRGTM